MRHRSNGVSLRRLADRPVRRRAVMSAKTAALTSIAAAAAFGALAGPAQASFPTPTNTPLPTIPPTPRPHAPEEGPELPAITGALIQLYSVTFDVKHYPAGIAVARYDIKVGSRPVFSTTSRTVVVSGLEPDTEYSVSVTAFSEEGAPSETFTTSYTTPPIPPPVGTGSLSMSYRCEIPNAGNYPIGITWLSDLPATQVVGPSRRTWQIDGRLEPYSSFLSQIGLVGHTWRYKRGVLDVSVQRPGQEPTSTGLVLEPAASQADDFVPSDEAPYRVVGRPEPLTFTSVGLTDVSVGDLALTFEGATSSDSDDLAVACRPEGGSGLILSRIESASEPQETPTPVITPTPTPTSISTPWVDPTPVVEPTPLIPTPTPGPTPNGNDLPVPYSYGLAGSATLKTLTKGSLPLSGGINAKLSLPSGNFTGELTLAPSTGNLTALGFLPVVAKVNLVPTDKVTGSLKGNKLTAVAKVRIKLPSVKTLGIELAGGANCQAKQISSITLTSTQANFLPLSGGPVAGSFDISDLSGCGFLTGIVSPLTKGTGNAIALNLTPRPYSVPTA